MRLGLRTKIFLVSVSLILISIIILGLFWGYMQQIEILPRVEKELGKHARAAKILVESVPSLEDTGIVDRLADKIGKATQTRVTIIDDKGRMKGDSTLTQRDVMAAENHRSRPEIIAGLETGQGKSRRFSTTTGQDMVYLAHRYEHREGKGVVRVSKPLQEIDEAIWGILKVLIVGGILALFIAIIISAFSSHYLSRAIRVLMDYAQQLAAGKDPEPIKIAPGDELGQLATAINRMSQKMRQHLNDLSQERDRFEAVLEGMSEAVIALNENRCITLINQAGMNLLGIGLQSLGRTLSESLPIPDLHHHMDSLSTETETSFEFELSKPSKKTVLAHTTTQKSGGIVIVFMDVTELRRLENIRRDFVANVSHELRTPVSIIRANAETLLDGAMDDREAAIRFLSSLLGNAELLSRLITDLLDISRIESGKVEIKPSKMKIQPVIERMASTITEKARERNISVDLEDAGAGTIVADAQALEQVLLNFLENAVKYIPQGSRIVLRATQDEDKTVIEVEDNGMGIRPQYRDRLFERFYRVDPGRSKEMGGTGLGLAIVKHLALAMGGETGMRPALPHGSIFWIALPK
jgi:two-component system phosphate regulon sensor histidine kinase PhoR